MRSIHLRRCGFWTAGILLGVSLLFGTTLALAQSQITTGRIEGTVTDPTGAAVAGAKVVIKHLATGVERELTTDDAGRFVAPLLDVGDYQITVSAPGFGTLIKSGYSLALGQTVVANISLTVAKVTETITVQGESPLVETARTEQSTLVTAQAVESLPLNGRRFLDLAFLTPLVTQELERNSLSVGGQRGINNSMNVDGADFNEPFFGEQRGGERSSAYVISQEAVREFQVVRSGFAPEFGRATGAVFNVITKSGGNEFHGSAFYYLRHREFAPRTVFGDDTAPVRQQFGGAVGGPIRKDKTFFYTVYDQQAEHQQLVIRFNSPTGLPANLLAQQGSSFTSTNDVHTYLAKVEHQLFKNTRISGRYSYSRNTGLNASFTGVTTGTLDNNGTEGDRTHIAAVTANTIISASLLNELRGAYSYENRPRLNNGEGPDFVSKVGPQVQITGCCFFGGVSFLPVTVIDSHLQFADNLSYIKGGHYLKVGFDFNRSHASEVFRGNWRGVYIFNTITNFVNNLNDPKNNAADQFRIFFGPGNFDAVQREVASFIQDAWKVHRRLTLTVGLRYEANLFPQPPTPNPLLLPQTAFIRNEIWEWQPRVGLSWDVFGNAKTVFRTSAGIFYARTPMLLMFQAFTANGSPNVGSGFTLSATQIKQARIAHPEFVFPFVPDSSSAANASFFTAAGIAGLKPDASFFDPNFRNPRSFNASAGIEHLLMTNLSVAFEWLHSNTVHLERIRDVNLPPPTLGPDNSVPPQIRPIYGTSRLNPNFGILRDQESSARANYDSLTLSLNKRGKKLQLLTSYTLAYSRDDDSNERNFNGIAYEDAFNLGQEYRWSREDIRQRASLSAVYDLPLGFEVSTLTSWRTGVPFSAFTNSDSNKDSQFTDKPIINGVHLARNLFRQPNFFNIDFRASKSFTIHENHKLALIFDMFNLINKHNFFYQVSTNESTTTAKGSIWGTGQTPAVTFRTIRLPAGTPPNCTNPKADPTLNCAGAAIFAPFQLQVALKYTF